MHISGPISRPSAIPAALLGAMDRLGIDYLDKRNALINAGLAVVGLGLVAITLVWAGLNFFKPAPRRPDPAIQAYARGVGLRE